jgi:hypothetical protein
LGRNWPEAALDEGQDKKRRKKKKGKEKEEPTKMIQRNDTAEGEEMHRRRGGSGVLLGCEGAGEEVGEVALDEGEDQHVPHRRDWNDEDDREGDQHQDVLGRAPQRLHLQKTGSQMTSASE